MKGIMKNKKGNIFFGVVIALFLWIMGVLFLPYIIDDVDTTRIDLSCSDTSISSGNKLTCLETDIVVPYLIWFFASLAIGYIAGANT
jgi:uncharacterized membrane protein